ncbi:sugar phosphate isomerase/epimerase family protein [Motilibacter deserti]|uniref:Sugar phosphate isomerase/epimerase n=1 Tax=Motilibacter deserti TaxID=2714956 RepID=A0ABX0GXS3_9ACTN|nr:sugar phosphate isomerase/epimerase [Motilibacter deserti]NHC15778.1 sugar phosphate isomerase/epimerase [Motilibacter deserti]
MSKLNRRGFLGLAGASAVGVAASPLLGISPANAALDVSAPDTPLENLGLQLYTVRDKITSLGFAVVFEELARIGYKEVEFAGYTQSTNILGRQITIAEIRKALDDNGLKAIGSHIGAAALVDPAQRDASFQAAVDLGMPYVGTANDFWGASSTPSSTNTLGIYGTARTISDLQRGVDSLNKAAVVAREMFGLKGIYQHNHQNEFGFATDNSAVRRYDVWSAGLDDSTGAFLEMDIAWAFKGARTFPGPTAATPGRHEASYLGGFDPADYVVANPNRYKLFHTKDAVPTALTANTIPGDLTPVEFGTGIVPFRAFFAKVGARAAATGVYEQDTATNAGVPGGSLGAAARSYDGMYYVRTLTWLDELYALVGRYVTAGRVKAAVGDDLQGRLGNAIKRYEGGHEESTIGYLGQFVAKVNNQVKGDDAAKAQLLTVANSILGWLQTSEDKENGVI